MKLKNLLLKWRDEFAVIELDHVELTDLGPSLFLPTKYIDRIVDCAHAQKLRNVEDLVRETK